MNDAVVTYTKTGLAHLNGGIGNQDYYFCAENDDAVFYAVSDGVSACADSAEGAMIACKTAAEILLDDVDYYFDSKKIKTAGLILDNIREDIRAKASASGKDPRSYSGTLSFVLSSKKDSRMMTFSVGDSRIYKVTDEGVSLISGSKNCSDNLTVSTMTADAADDAELEIIERKDGESYILCTDGVWKGLTDHPEVVMNDPETIESSLDNEAQADDCTFLFIPQVDRTEKNG